MYNLPGLFWGSRRADLNGGNTHRAFVWRAKIARYLQEKIQRGFFCHYVVDLKVKQLQRRDFIESYI